MTSPATPIYIPKKAQQGLIELKSTYINSFTLSQTVRNNMIDIDRSYMREKDITIAQSRARIANRAGDSSKFQNVEVPIVYPQVEAAVEYQTEVFCTGYPIFSFTAPVENWDAAEQMNVIMEENSTRGGWAAELMMAFRDGFKYNILAIEADWDSCSTAVIDTDLSKNTKQGVTKELIWSGNVVKRIDLYNAFWDMRYAPRDMASRGEFFGYHKLMSRTEMKSFLMGLDCLISANMIPALESPVQPWGNIQDNPQGYSVPQIRQDIDAITSSAGEPDWNAWVDELDQKNAGKSIIRYGNSYILTILYARIIPVDFLLRVSSENTPQIWKLYYVNNTILVGAKRMTNAHNLLPVLMGQPLDDGLGYQTKSLAKNVEGIQDLSSALLNSVIAARRKSISDRTIYDPSRIAPQHINSDNPSAKIPIKPAAYGKPLSEAVYPFPFRDDQSGIILQEFQQITQIADQVSGQNRARRGQFQKGNKTLHEYQDVQDNSTGRDKMCSIGLEATVMTPLKTILKLNIIQYQGVAEIFSTKLRKNVNIDPVALRNAAIAFDVSDGLLPSSKILNTEAIQSGFQTLAQVPGLAAGYNLPPMFSYIMKTQNADLSQFEKPPEQVAYEQAVQNWQQIAQLTAEKGGDTSKLPPQPLPQQFNYDPSKGPAPTPTAPNSAPATVQTNYQIRSTSSSNNAPPVAAAPIKTGT